MAKRQLSPQEIVKEWERLYWAWFRVVRAHAIEKEQDPWRSKKFRRRYGRLKTRLDHFARLAKREHQSIESIFNGIDFNTLLSLHA